MGFTEWLLVFSASLVIWFAWSRAVWKSGANQAVCELHHLESERDELRHVYKEQCLAAVEAFTRVEKMKCDRDMLTEQVANLKDSLKRREGDCQMIANDRRRLHETLETERELAKRCRDSLRAIHSETAAMLRVAKDHELEGITAKPGEDNTPVPHPADES